MPAISLTDLQRQIAQREQELQALRQELESRQGHLTELTRRKDELQRELQQVEKEITTLAATLPAEREQSSPAPPATPSISKSASAKDQPRLGELIVDMLRESSEPMTARQLYEEAQRRGYQTSSRDPLKTLENRLQDLKSKGIIRRASGQYGFLLASSNNGTQTKKSKTPQPAEKTTPKPASRPARSEPAAKKSSGKGTPAAEAAKTARPARRGEQPSLRMVLTEILKKSRKPLSGSELAERALAAGYKTKSAKFVDSVWTALGQMDNVEHLPQQGYRLKKS